jgi:hypothetical protein
VTLREVCSNKCRHRKRRKAVSKQLNDARGPRKTRTKPRISERKETIKIRAEVNRDFKNKAKDQWNEKLAF